jgi:Domain of unknown function (DUF5658)
MPIPPGPRARRRLVVGTPQHFRWLHGIVAVLLVLNLVDAVFTLFWVGSGFAREANALLEPLVLDHPLLFVGAKLALVSLGSLLMWHWRERPAAVVGLFAAFLVYYLVLLHHLSYAGGFLRALIASAIAA